MKKITKKEFIKIWTFHCEGLQITNNLETTRDLRPRRTLLREMGTKLCLIEKNGSFDNIDLLCKIFKLSEDLGLLDNHIIDWK